MLRRYFEEPTADTDGQTNWRPWLFPRLATIARKWMAECLTCQGNAFPQLLLIEQYKSDGADKIYRSIVRSAGGDKRLVALLRTYEPVGDHRSRRLRHHQARPVDQPREVSTSTTPWLIAVGNTGSIWTSKRFGTGLRYVKNQGLGFTIPYTLDGQPRSYYPDFLVDLDDGHGADDLLHLVVEVSGERDREKQVKVDTARTLWIPAVNNVGRFGRWQFIEVTDPFEAADVIGAIVDGASRSELMAPRKAPAKKAPPQIESVQHKDKRVNIPTEEQRDFVADAERDPVPVQYDAATSVPEGP